VTFYEIVNKENCTHTTTCIGSTEEFACEILPYIEQGFRIFYIDLKPITLKETVGNYMEDYMTEIPTLDDLIDYTEFESGLTIFYYDEAFYKTKDVMKEMKGASMKTTRNVTKGYIAILVMMLIAITSIQSTRIREAETKIVTLENGVTNGVANFKGLYMAYQFNRHQLSRAIVSLRALGKAYLSCTEYNDKRGA